MSHLTHKCEAMQGYRRLQCESSFFKQGLVKSASSYAESSGSVHRCLWSCV